MPAHSVFRGQDSTASRMFDIEQSTTMSNEYEDCFTREVKIDVSGAKQQWQYVSIGEGSLA